MNTNFEEELTTLFVNMENDTLLRLQKNNKDYKNLISRFSNLSDTLYRICETDEELNNSYKSHIKDLLDISIEKNEIEKMAIYFQGFIDYTQILKKFGFINI